MVFDNLKNANNVSKSSKDMSDVMQAAVVLQMYKNAKTCCGASGNVTVQVLPHKDRKVVVNRDYNVAGDFTLQCYGGRLCKVDTTVTASADKILVVAASGDITQKYEIPHPTAPKKKDDHTTVVTPFWFVRRVDPGAENCVMKDATVTADGFTTTIPCIVNTKAIKKGDEAKVAK
jgi:hypothetical protein